LRLLFIYFYKEHATFEKGTIIHLSKKYKFSLNKDKSTEEYFYFNKEENTNFLEDFYSKNIDIGVLIGENGTGKSILLNSCRDKNNNYAITIYEKNGSFYCTGNLNTKEIKLNNINIIKENNQKFIYFSHAYENQSIDDLSNNISNQYFLSVYDNYSKTLKDKLSWIENDDIKRFFDFSSKYKIDGVSLPKVKLEYNPNFYNTIKINNLINHENIMFEISNLYEKKLDFEHKKELIKSFFSKINDELKNTINIHPVLSNIDAQFNSLIQAKNIDFLINYASQICVNLSVDTKLIEDIAEEYHEQEKNIHEVQILINYCNELNSFGDFSIKKFDEIMLALNPFIQKIFDSNTEENKISLLLFILKYIEGHPWFISLKDYDSNLFEKLIIYYFIENDRVDILERIDYKLKLDIAQNYILDGTIYLIDILDKDIDLRGILYENIDYLFKIIQQNSINKEIQKLIYILKYEKFYSSQSDILKLQYYLFQKYNEDLVIDYYINDQIPQTRTDKENFVTKQNEYFEKLKLDQNNNLEVGTVVFDDYNQFKNKLTFPFNYEMSPKPSSGEKTRLILFARLFKEIYRQEPHSNIILLLDELDLTLHLEWQRKIISTLLHFLNSLPYKFYILYATHSPMILSDIAADRVVFLENDGLYSTDASENDKKSTFGANIYDIYNDSFFMKSFMGSFAETKINQIIDILNTIKNLESNEIVENKYRESYNQFFDESLEKETAFSGYKSILSNSEKQNKIIQTVHLIGEPMLKNKLLNDIKYLFDEYKDIDNIVKELRDKDHTTIKEKLKNYSQSEQNEILKKLYLESTDD